MTENELLNFIKKSVDEQNEVCKKLNDNFNTMDKKFDRLESHIESEIGKHGYLPRQIQELTQAMNTIRISLFGDNMNYIGIVREHDELKNRVSNLEEKEKSRIWWMRAIGGAVLALAGRVLWTMIFTGSS